MDLKNIKDLLIKKNILFHCISILLFAFITIIYCSPILEEQRIKQGDIIQFQGMSKEIQDFRQKTGDEALWTNSMFGGMPAYQISVKYPNNILLHIDKALQLGFPRPIGVMFLYFLGFYILMLSMKLDYKLAFLASIAFGLSSYFLIILEAGHNTKAHAISYMAPTIAGMLWCLRGKRLLGFFLTFLFLGLQIRANHPQISYYLMFVVFSFWLTYLIYSIKDKKIKFFASNTLIFVLGCFLAIMINIASLWSTYDYSKYTMRGGSDLIQEESGLKKDYAMQWSYGKIETFNLLIPNLYGGVSKSFLEDKNSEVYKNFLKIQSEKEIEFKGRIQEWVSKILGLDINLLNSLGSKYQLGSLTEEERLQFNMLNEKLESSNAIIEQKQNEIYQDVFSDFSELQKNSTHYWGGQIMTSGPVYVGAVLLLLFILSIMLIFYDSKNIRILKISLLGLCLFSLLLSWGKNLDFFNNLFFNSFPLYNKFRTVSMILVIVQFIVPVIAVLGLSQFLNSNIDKNIKRKKVLLSGGLLVFICLLFLIFWEQFYVVSSDLSTQYSSFFDSLKNARFSLLKDDVFRSVFLIVSCCIILMAFCLNKLNRNWVVILITCLILFDLVDVDKRYLNNDDFVSKNEMNKPFSFPANNDEIKLDTTVFRVFNFNEGFSGTNTSYYFHSLGGYHGAKLSKYQNLIDSVFYHRNPVQALLMLNTKYLINNGSLVKTKDEFGKTPLGNAWFVENIDTVETNVNELTSLRSFFFDARKTAIIHRDQLDYVKDFQYDNSGSISLITNKEDYNPSRLVYKTSNLKSPQLAVFSEIFYPKGWRAYIDKEEVDYFRVNYLLRGLIIPKGEHEVVFEFKPNSFYIGNKLALGSSIIFLITFFTLLIYYFKPELLNNIYSRSEV